MERKAGEKVEEVQERKRKDKKRKEMMNMRNKQYSGKNEEIKKRNLT